MFDYLGSTDKKPIVVSEEDVVGNAEALLDALSEALGIARGGLRVSWSLVSPEERREADWERSTWAFQVPDWHSLDKIDLCLWRMPRRQPDV